MKSLQLLARHGALSLSPVLMSLSIVSSYSLPAQAQSIDANGYYRLTNQWQGSDKSLDIVNDGRNNQVQMAPTADVTGQKWILTPTGDGYYRLTTLWLGNNKSLDVVNDGNNNKLQMVTTGNVTGQKWKVTPLDSGYVRLTTKWQGTDKSLDVVNDGKNNQLQLAKTGNFTGQKWKLNSVGTTAGVPDTIRTLGTEVKTLAYLNTETRENGLQTFVYENANENIKLGAIEGQTPQMFLVNSATVGVYKNQRYVNFSTVGSRVAASTTGKMVKNQQDLRGWYLEYVDVSIESLNPGFTLPSYGPSISQQEGSVTSSSGIDFSSGLSLSGKDGPSANLSIGLNFGMSYSSNLTSFRVLDNSTENKVITKTKLTSTNASETWSNPKGGNAPYDTSNDLIRIDAAGQFSGTPLNYLPDLAISNLPLSSIGTFKATNDFKGIALFKVKVKMHLLKVEKTNKVFSVNRKTEVKDLAVERIYAIDMNR